MWILWECWAQRGTQAVTLAHAASHCRAVQLAIRAQISTMGEISCTELVHLKIKAMGKTVAGLYQLDQGSYVSVVLVDPRGRDWWIDHFYSSLLRPLLDCRHSFNNTMAVLPPPAHLGVAEQLQHSWTVAVGCFLRTRRILRIKQLIFPSWSRSALQCGHKHKRTFYMS